MELSAVWAGGKGPVRDGESVLDLSARLGVTSKEAGSEGVGLGSESIDGDGPADRPGQAVHLIAEKRGADRAGDVEGASAGEVVNAFLDESAAGRMQVQRVAADATLEAARAHGAMLQEGGREAAFAEGREGADSIVVEEKE